MWYIYVLCDPRESDPIKRVRYVGATKDYVRRLKSHRANRFRYNNHCTHWLRLMFDQLKLMPVIEIIETGETEWKTGDWEKSEIKWIAHYRSIGSNLCNSTNGGEGIKGLPEDVKIRWKEKLKGQKPRLGQTNSLEHNQRISDSLKATYSRGEIVKKKHIFTDEERKRRSESAKRLPIDVVKQLHTAAIKANSYDDETIQYIIDLRSRGGTYESIVHVLNEQGIKTKKGNPWNISTVYVICRRSFNEQIRQETLDYIAKRKIKGD